MVLMRLKRTKINDEVQKELMLTRQQLHMYTIDLPDMQ